MQILKQLNVGIANKQISKPTTINKSDLDCPVVSSHPVFLQLCVVLRLQQQAIVLILLI